MQKANFGAKKFYNPLWLSSEHSKDSEFMFKLSVAINTAQLVINWKYFCKGIAIFRSKIFWFIGKDYYYVLPESYRHYNFPPYSSYC